MITNQMSVSQASNIASDVLVMLLVEAQFVGIVSVEERVSL
jgi:hypothetical protein